MPETYEYEVSSESGRERHIAIPWARMTDTTPTLGQPAEVTSLTAGRRLTGVVVNAGTATAAGGTSEAILNVARGATYYFNVRNVLTYTAGPVAEATWGPINIGDCVYYDAEQDALNGVKLSTAPVQSDASTRNTLFGFVVMNQDEDADDFPKGTDQAGSTQECAVCFAGPEA